MITPDETAVLDRGHPGCPSTEALEEYAVHCQHTPLRCPDPYNAHQFELDRHVQVCDACAERLASFAKESADIIQTLTHAPTPSSACIEDLDLAIYLDNAVVSAQSGRLESDQAQLLVFQNHLAECRTCQDRLVALYRDLRAVLADIKEPPQQESVSLEEAYIRRQSAQPTPAPSTQPGLDNKDALPSPPTVSEDQSDEERKQRYSSRSS